MSNKNDFGFDIVDFIRVCYFTLFSSFTLTFVTGFYEYFWMFLFVFFAIHFGLRITSVSIRSRYLELLNNKNNLEDLEKLDNDVTTQP